MAGEGLPREETNPVGLRRKRPGSNVRQALCVGSAWLRALLRRLKEQQRLGELRPGDGEQLGVWVLALIEGRWKSLEESDVM